MVLHNRASIPASATLRVPFGQQPPTLATCRRRCEPHQWVRDDDGGEVRTVRGRRPPYGAAAVTGKIIASLTWSLFTSLLTHRPVLVYLDAYCFISWDLPGDVLAAPCISLVWLDRCHTSLSLR